MGTVNSGSYIGLRSQLPEEYHSKTCTILAYYGLLYHDLFLTTEEETVFFKEYDVSEVRKYIMNVTYNSIVENIDTSIISRSYQYKYYHPNHFCHSVACQTLASGYG